MFGDDDDDRPSVLDQISGAFDGDSGRTRTQDPCDECGDDAGSKVHDRDEGWTLCRDCMNDPEVLGKYV